MLRNQIQDWLDGKVESSDTEGAKRRWKLFWKVKETLSTKEFQKLLVICWAIWGAWRKALHEDIFQNPLSIFSFITKYLDDLKLSGLIEDDETAKSIRNKQPTPKWIAPPEAFLKFNVDGAVARSGDKGTIGVVCRDNVGNYIAASAMVIDGLNDPSSLEALACNEAISLAMDMDVQKCVIASDCLEVIMNLQKQSLCAYSSVLKEIKARSTLFQEIVFKHEGRESNCEAHALAKNVCKLAPGRYVWLFGRPDFLHVP